MQWDKQQQAALNGWFTAPQQAWTQWWDLFAGGTQNGHAKAATPPIFDFWNSLATQWQSAMQQSLAGYSPDLAESARTAMSQFLMGQGHAQQLLKLATDAWQAILRDASSPAEWQQALTRYMDEQRRGMANAADATKYLQNSAELWQLYSTEIQKLSQPWFALWTQMPQHIGMMGQPRTAGTEANTNPLLAMTNLYWDTYNQTLGRMVNLPSLGLLREFNEKVNRGFTLWQENQQNNLAYQLLLGDGLLQAFEAFMQKLLALAKEGKTVDNQTKLLELWVAVADEQFLELFHSERYAQAQSQYVNSSMALRSQQRELVEIMLRMNDLPTRSDLDEAHHNIFLLRKEVKALKKTVHMLVEQNRAPKESSATEQPAAPSSTKKPAAPKRRAKAAQASEGAA
jgi:polyhydroxyalkanoate synthase subunit PhaE